MTVQAETLEISSVYLIVTGFGPRERWLRLSSAAACGQPLKDGRTGREPFDGYASFEEGGKWSDGIGKPILWLLQKKDLTLREGLYTIESI